jgi:hypothetical protein
MTEGEIYITRLSAWAPGIESSSGWDDWASGKLNISSDAKGPEISFTDSMFRRRLSQISKMTIQVIHDLLPINEDTKIFFLSFRGEITRQYQINKMLIEEKALSPAAFSLSVFNAPAALASMALGLKGGYSAVYPEKNSFYTGLQAARSALLCGTSEELLFVYADEEVKPEYACFFNECPPPSAFGLLLSRTKTQAVKSVPIPQFKAEDDPLIFLKELLLKGGIHVSP